MESYKGVGKTPYLLKSQSYGCTTNVISGWKITMLMEVNHMKIKWILPIGWTASNGKAKLQRLLISQTDGYQKNIICGWRVLTIERR